MGPPLCPCCSNHACTELRSLELRQRWAAEEGFKWTWHTDGQATIFRMMHGPGVLARARANLSSTWVRQLLWKRCQKGAPEKFDELAKVLLCLSVEALVQKSWRWYGPLMFRRRLEQVRWSGDRADILAIDGNAKLCAGADARIQARRARRMALRKQGAAGKKGRKEKSFMASWSSNGPRAASECSTRKETDAHIVAAARAAGFLTAVSASGILAHVEELMCAEPLSQRYRLLAIVAAHMPDLKIVVHDDACHLRLMAEKNGEGTAVAARLATETAYIVDDYHSSGHVGKWCSEHCLPGLEANSLVEQLSPLGHVIHRVGRWASQFYVQEMVGALNMKTLGRMRGAQATAAGKVARASEAASASAEKKPRQL
ncbi:unnamed protein product [Prorocentrum cordatum]|uniref:Uncharacterized protein n=1 Tax=Prorocentrum cordatum TaxID=2364126 RepID=A0ABN9SIB3_9DINO|nr:unnamed protein product [Polarella glacialis]